MAIEQLRMFLLVAICFISFLLWQAWQRDYGPEAAIPQGTEQTRDAQAPLVAPVTEEDIPALPKSDVTITAQSPEQPEAHERPEGVVVVVTDTVRAVLDLAGGGLRKIELLLYPVSADSPEQSFALLDQTPQNIFIGQTGLLSEGPAPNHHALFEAERSEYVLREGADSISIPLRWRDASGVSVTKTYVFRRDSYLIDLNFDVKNDTSNSWAGRSYGQFQRNRVPSEGGLFRTYSYTGGVVSNEEKPYKKIDFGDMGDANLQLTVTGGWAAMLQHYFVGALIPAQDANNFFYTKALANERFVIGMMSPSQRLSAGQTGRLGMQLYVGPKLQERMEQAAPNLERTVDYGWLWLIAEPIFHLLNWIHSYVGNWGWSIILVTLLIKLLFFHLSATSYKSMARMRKLQPRVTALRERYGTDKQRMNQAMMALYKEEKINPLGGCFPILVQIPVFISLYWVLLESVELRQAEFIFWLTDLSVHDPYFVLPVMMGVTMLAQQRLNPAPPDPMQAKIMMALPFVFTFLFLFFPSGLVLYWFVNNLLSIAQQWVITKKIIDEK